MSPADQPTVLDAVRTLLDVQGHATVAQIVRYTRRTYPEVVDTLARNRKFYELKGSRIVSLRRLWDQMHQARLKALADGKFYEVREINYGADRAIKVRREDLVARLGRPYTSGGLGDSETTTEILATAENIAAVEAAGVRPAGEWKDNPYRYWQEEHPEGAK